MTDTAHETPISELAARAIALMQGGACIRIVPENDPSFSSHTFSAPVVALIAAALEPDPTPALGWRSMQTAAVELMQSASAKCRENFTYPAKTKEQRDWQTGAIIHANAATAILALPGPTDAQLLAEAVKLPQWQAMAIDMREVRLAVNALEGKDRLDRELITAISARIDAALAKIGGAA